MTKAFPRGPRTFSLDELPGWPSRNGSPSRSACRCLPDRFRLYDEWVSHGWLLRISFCPQGVALISSGHVRIPATVLAEISPRPTLNPTPSGVKKNLAAGSWCFRAGEEHALVFEKPLHKWPEGPEEVRFLLPPRPIHIEHIDFVRPVVGNGALIVSGNPTFKIRVRNFYAMKFIQTQAMFTRETVPSEPPAQAPPLTELLKTTPTVLQKYISHRGMRVFFFWNEEREKISVAPQECARRPADNPPSGPCFPPTSRHGPFRHEDANFGPPRRFFREREICFQGISSLFRATPGFPPHKLEQKRVIG